MPRRRTIRRRSRSSTPVWPVVAVSVVVAFGVGYYLGSRSQTAARPADQGEPESSRAAERQPEPPPQPKRRVSPEFAEAPRLESRPAPAIEPGEGARVALVIDDLGRRVEDVNDFASLGVPLSYGVLPFESRTAQVVEALRRRNAEILCHLPMEPSNGANPGPGALTRAMGRRELIRATEWALEATPGAVGVNNHMGSQLTADREVMAEVLRVLARRDLFFLDSRTTAQTVAYTTARELGLPAAERQVFLDPESGPDTVREQFARLLDLARRRGAAIAIGHPHPSTLEVLRDQVPKASAAGYAFVPVSTLLDRSQEPS